MKGDIENTTSVNGEVLARTVLNGEVSAKAILGETHLGSLVIEHIVGPLYNGPYEIIPAIQSQMLPSKNTYLIEEIVVKEIPYREEDNESGGKTVFIGT